MIRSHKQANELQTVKIVPINKSELTDNILLKKDYKSQQKK